MFGPRLNTLCFLFMVSFTLHAMAAETPRKVQKLTPQQSRFFENRIRPVLVKHCYECHARDSKEVGGGLYLDTREGIRAGGDTGHAIVPRNLEDSLLIESIKYESCEMPPSQQLPEQASRSGCA